MSLGLCLRLRFLTPVLPLEAVREIAIDRRIAAPEFCSGNARASYRSLSMTTTSIRSATFFVAVSEPTKA